MRVKWWAKRQREASITPSKGDGSEKGEKEKERGRGEDRRGRVMNALTVTMSSIKQPHYTLISAHTCKHTHTRRRKHTYAHRSWPYPFPWSLMQLVNHNRGFWAVASRAYPADSLALIMSNKHKPQRHNRMWCRTVTEASNSPLPSFWTWLQWWWDNSFGLIYFQHPPFWPLTLNWDNWCQTNLCAMCVKECAWVFTSTLRSTPM